MQKKLLISLFQALLIIHSSLLVVHAVSPSPSPSPSESPASIEEINENVKKRLQDSLKTAAPTPTSSARAYIGKVKDVIGGTIIIQDKDGKRDIKLGDDATILRSPGNVAIDEGSIRIDDYVIAIGYPGEGEILIGRRLIVSATPIATPAKSSGLGTITKISKSSLTLQVGDQEQVIGLTSKTIVKSPVAIIELTDLSAGDKLVYTATLGKDDNLTATLLMRIRTASLEE